MHWEKTVMGNDYMTATTQPHMVISDITLALFEDSGWYMPNYTYAEEYNGNHSHWWGKNRGCDFPKHYSCPLGDPQSNRTGEFCTFSDSE